MIFWSDVHVIIVFFSLTPKQKICLNNICRNDDSKLAFSWLHVHLPTVSYLWDVSSVGLSVLLILVQQWLSSANCTAVFAAPHCGLDVAVMLG